MKEINFLALEHIMQTGGEGALPLFKGSYKMEFPANWNFINPVFSTNADLETLHNRLFEAVAEKIITTNGQDVAVLLSGGVDSVTLLGYLTKFFPDTNVVAYHTNWNYPARSEIEHAHLAADFCNVKLRVVDVSPKAQVPFIEEALAKTRTPDYTIIAAYMAFKQMKADGINVAFNGLGLDEYLSGYPIHRRLYDRMNSRFPKIIPAINSSSKPIRWAMRKFGNDKAFFYSNTMLNPYLQFCKTEEIPVNQMVDNFYNDVKQTNLWDTIQVHLAKGMFHNYATNITRAAQAADVTVDFPYLDYKLASYCFSIPPLQKYNKDPLRQLMVKMLYIPESLAQRGWNWHDGSNWDKYAWGGTVEPYFESQPFMSQIESNATKVNEWFTDKALVKYYNKPNRVNIQMLLFLKIMELVN